MTNELKDLCEKDIFVTRETDLLTALKKMDEEQVKLLIVLEGEKFFSILSIGDIQRAIISNKDLSTPVEKILRKKVRVAFDDEPLDVVYERMMSFRTECMPVIDKDNNLVQILFWEDVFQGTQSLREDQLSVPVVIMAGGQGSRLKPITNIIPKPLVPLGEKPIMEIIMDRFYNLGVRRFIASVNYRYQMIEFYFSQMGETNKFDLTFVKEEEPLGTAGSLRLMKSQLTSTFFVSNCDILIDEDYREIYDFHKANKNDLTVVAALHHYQIPYGTLDTKDNGRLDTLSEKPELTFKINTGMYVVEPSALELIPSHGPSNVTDLIEALRVQNRPVGVFPVSEKSWMDIGQWNEYQKSLKTFAMRRQSIK